MTKLENTLANYECPGHANYILNCVISSGFRLFSDARNFDRTISRLKRDMYVNSYKIKLWNDYKKAYPNKKSEEYLELVGKIKFTSSEQRLLRNVMALLVQTRTQFSIYTSNPSTDIIGGYKFFIARVTQAMEITRRVKVKQDGQMCFEF